MKHTPILIALASGLFFLNSIHSQDMSPISLSLGGYPPLLGKNYASTMRLNLGYPLYRSDHTTLLAGVTFANYRHNIQTELIKTDHRYYLGVPLLLMQDISKKYRLMVSFEIGYSSDISCFSQDVIRYNSTISLMRTKGDTVPWSVLVKIDRQSSGLSIHPMLYTNIRIYDRLYFNGVLPYKPKLTWKANTGDQYGIGVTSCMNTFYLGEYGPARYVEETQADFDVFYHYCINKNFKIFCSLGYTFIHKIKLYEQGEKAPVRVYMLSTAKKAPANIEPTGVVIKAGIYWSLSD